MNNEQSYFKTEEYFVIDVDIIIKITSLKLYCYFIEVTTAEI